MKAAHLRSICFFFLLFLLLLLPDVVTQSCCICCCIIVRSILQVLCIPKPISIITLLDPWQRGGVCVSFSFVFAPTSCWRFITTFKWALVTWWYIKNRARYIYSSVPPETTIDMYRKQNLALVLFTIYTCQYIGKEDEWYKQFYAWKLLPKLIFTMTSTAWKMWSCLATKTSDTQKFRYCNLFPEHNTSILCARNNRYDYIVSEHLLKLLE